MKVKTPKALRPTAYAEKLKLIISTLPLPMSRKIDTARRVTAVCYQQTNECINGHAMAALLAARRVGGFGKRRLMRLLAQTQSIMDEYAHKYDTAAADAMKRDLAAVGVSFDLSSEVTDAL